MDKIPIIKKIWTDDPVEMTSKLAGLKSSSAYASRYIVFKVSSGLIENIQHRNDILAQSEERSHGRDLYLISFDKLSSSHLIHRIQSASLSIIEDGGLLNEIRNFDLIEVIERSKGDCILESPVSGHFITPSGKHADKFLRIADAIYSYNALDRISYWLQPFFASAAGIITDTWSLVSVVLQTQNLLGIQLPFNCFSSNIKTNPIEGEKVLNQFKSRISKSGPIISLISVSVSGDSALSAERKLNRLGLDNEIITIAIFSLESREGFVSFSQPHIGIEWYPDDKSCNFCKSEGRNRKYVIDQKLYYPKECSETEVLMGTKNLEDFPVYNIETTNRTVGTIRDFISSYGGIPGVLSVHREDPNDGSNPRHHSYYIDILKLASSSDFVERYKKELECIVRDFGVPDLLITPPHEAGKILVSIANETLLSKVIINHDLSSLSENETHLFRSAKTILVLDDVFISGTRTLNYLENIRTKYSCSHLENLIFFSMVFRPEYFKREEEINDSLKKHRWKNEIRYLYKFVLPCEDETICPWCLESKFLDSLSLDAFSADDWLLKRLVYLKHNSQEGITENPIFVLPGSNLGALGGSSPLAPKGTSELQLLFIVASGLQSLRNDRVSPLGGSLLSNNVLSNKTFSRYSEALIQAVFLRSARITEWSDNIISGSFRAVGKKVKNGKSHELIGEVLLFLVQKNKLNEMCPKIKAEIYNKFPDENNPIRILLNNL